MRAIFTADEVAPVADVATDIVAEMTCCELVNGPDGGRLDCSCNDFLC